ncbi:MFS transporter [Corynebacterium sp. 13CS0277]|uniref:MFS transporter n=1 Tax=Corynebacterium sp. 13CS0277 TaxID=2071994 RepID=UPI000D0305F7|nr:MFS transporter [Corynebacterium sp. 13CS0277]PRQ10412.1 MFS transporter [Corynebacterium sp. 13CS0277]
MTSTTPVSRRAFVVWFAGTMIYMMAILGRTSLGVAGVQAMEHFHIDASRLAVFTSVQVGVYALAQIPMGAAIDRFQPRLMLLVGAVIMAAGQLVLGLTTSYGVAIAARVLVGVGDASAFLSVMRLIPAWFPPRRAPLMSQLLASIGWGGQFLSAVPFLAYLEHAGWRSAFLALGVLGIGVAVVAALFIRNAPTTQATRTKLQLGTVVRQPVCWEGFFTHWVGLLPNLVFTLLWGVPLLTLGVGLSPQAAGRILVVGVCITIVVSPAHGMLSARLRQRRSLVTVALNACYFAALGVFFASPTPRGWLFAAAVTCLGFAIVPASNFGFDSVREQLAHRSLATGTGLANMGGFVAVMIAGQLMGLILDALAPDGHYTWAVFRVAWLAVFGTWAAGVIALLVVRRPRVQFVA